MSSSSATQPWVFALASAALGAVVVWLLVFGQRVVRRRRRRRRWVRGRRGEEQAPALLAELGFEVTAAEQRLEGVVEIDGEDHPFEVRVDLLARRGRRLYAVEVKTGAQATDPLHRATRRQLREYAALLGVDGIFLLDMERRALHSVRFPELTRAASRRALFGALLLGLALGAGLGALAHAGLTRGAGEVRAPRSGLSAAGGCRLAPREVTP